MEAGDCCASIYRIKAIPFQLSSEGCNHLNATDGCHVHVGTRLGVSSGSYPIAALFIYISFDDSSTVEEIGGHYLRSSMIISDMGLPSTSIRLKSPIGC